MNNDKELQLLKKCLELIEEKLNRGTSTDWTGYDFEQLSTEIQMATGVLLSVTTLKRLWGKLKYTNIPTSTTLNTLAQYAGYTDWRDFKQTFPLSPATDKSSLSPISEKSPLSPAVQPVAESSSSSAGKAGWKKYCWLGLLPILLIGCMALLSYVKTEKNIDPADYQFSSNKIKTAGVPNSVIFNYDAKAAGTADVFIAQSWDVSRKVALDPSKNTYSAIYYHPGYYRAKLIVGNQIVKEHDLMISSDGWVANVSNEKGVPVYFKKEEVLKNGVLAVDEALLARYHLPLQPSLPKLRFFNIRDMEGMKNDNFTLETTVKTAYNRGTAACQRLEVLIICKDEVISIPLSSKGCVGDLSLYVAGTTVNSKDTDLSKFGCDLDQWVKLRVQAKDRQVSFFVNDILAYTVKFSSDPAEIVGLQYRFNGTGAVKNTKFFKDDQVIDFY